MSQTSRALGVAQQLARLYPEFTVIPPHEQDNPNYVTVINLRGPDHTTLTVSHHPPMRAKDKSEVHIAVGKIDEAPWGLKPPWGKWNAARMDDEQIARAFQFEYGDAMRNYLTRAIAARKEAIAFYESREAFAQQLATAGNGTYRPARKPGNPAEVPSVESIYCAAVNAIFWRVEHFNHSSTTLQISATDEQALAIVRLLANLN